MKLYEILAGQDLGQTEFEVTYRTWNSERGAFELKTTTCKADTYEQAVSIASKRFGEFVTSLQYKGWTIGQHTDFYSARNFKTNQSIAPMYKTWEEIKNVIDATKH